jgi:cytochrome b
MHTALYLVLAVHRCSTIVRTGFQKQSHYTNSSNTVTEKVVTNVECHLRALQLLVLEAALVLQLLHLCSAVKTTVNSNANTISYSGSCCTAHGIAYQQPY